MTVQINSCLVIVMPFDVRVMPGKLEAPITSQSSDRCLRAVLRLVQSVSWLVWMQKQEKDKHHRTRYMPQQYHLVSRGHICCEEVVFLRL